MMEIKTKEAFRLFIELHRGISKWFDMAIGGNWPETEAWHAIYQYLPLKTQIEDAICNLFDIPEDTTANLTQGELAAGKGYCRDWITEILFDFENGVITFDKLIEELEKK